MNLQIIFTHLEPTDAIKGQIEKKSKKFEKYFHRNFDLKWTCSVEKDEHTSHVILSGEGFVFNARSTKDLLYKTFDDVIAKLEKQVSKKMTQRHDHIHQERLSDFMREEL